MLFSEVPLADAWVIDIEPVGDQRGFFSRVWCKREFEKLGLKTDLAQANVAFNEKKGTLRGMHFQCAPYQEVKVVRCTRGAIYDVIVDIRKNSATYGKWYGVELTQENSRMLYVPEGFAHGYQTLVDKSEIFYMVSEYYTPGSEGGLRWDDPRFGIEWPEEAHRLISDKDKNWLDFSG